MAWAGGDLVRLGGGRRRRRGAHRPPERRRPAGPRGDDPPLSPRRSALPVETLRWGHAGGHPLFAGFRSSRPAKTAATCSPRPETGTKCPGLRASGPGRILLQDRGMRGQSFSGSDATARPRPRAPPERSGDAGHEGAAGFPGDGPAASERIDPAPEAPAGPAEERESRNSGGGRRSASDDGPWFSATNYRRDDTPEAVPAAGPDGRPRIGLFHVFRTGLDFPAASEAESRTSTRGSWPCQWNVSYNPATDAIGGNQLHRRRGGGPAPAPGPLLAPGFRELVARLFPSYRDRRQVKRTSLRPAEDRGAQELLARR